MATNSSPLLAPLKSTGALFKELSQTFSLRKQSETHSRTNDIASNGPNNSTPNLKPTLTVAIPTASIVDANQQIVAGVLFKHINLTGWRPRLFVLYGGVLRYYKIYGPTAVNVHTLLEILRQEGQLYTVGAEISLLEERDQSRKKPFTDDSVTEGRVNNGGSNNAATATAPIATSTTTSFQGTATTSIGGGDGSTSTTTRGTPTTTGTTPSTTGGGSLLQRLPPASAEVHLQVASIFESGTDSRVFSVNSGTAVLRLRAECKEDRWVWLEALNASKNAWQGLTPTTAGALRPVHSGRVKIEDDEFLTRLASIQQTLIAKGATPAITTFVEDQLTADHQRYHELLLTEENKRRVLLEMILGLENEKRQLETALIVEGRKAPKSKNSNVFQNDDGGNGSESPRGSDSESLEPGGVSMTENDLREDNESEIEDYEFHECETASGSISLAAATAGLTLSSSGGVVGSGGVGLGSHSRSASGSSITELNIAGVGVAPSPFVNTDTTSGSGSLTTTTTTTTTTSKTTTTTSTTTEAVPSWFTKIGPPPPRRDRLPVPAQKERSVSLWSLIKEMVGKDLTRVCLPVYFNEPLSALQKTAEDLEYSELLDEAFNYPPGSIERLLRVAAFAVSAYSSTVGRTAKPFNPLLNETYELVHPEKGFRFIGEKVSHHPTILAAQAEGRHWVFEGDAEVKSRFWGRSIELHPVGVLRVTFSDGDEYCWNKVVTSINNLILGRIYVDHGGIMKVRCTTNGLTARIRFKETGMLFDKDPRQVRGHFEKDGVRFPYPILQGHWDDDLSALYEDNNSSILLWKKSPPPPEPTRYNLTGFSIQLNELTPGLKGHLAPTDSRLRPDQSYTERGMWDEANSEKQRLEHKQRAARKAAERGEPLQPRWFEQLDSSSSLSVKARHPDELAFKYKGGYWEEREGGRFTGCRDIFGQEVVDVLE